jgi:phospholipase A1/A2
VPFFILITALSFSILAFAGPDRVGHERDDKRTFIEIEHHKRNYFISGEPNTKVQFSAKIPIRPGSQHYLAYSQKMIWELFTKTSSPVPDVNFNPEYFYRVTREGGGILRGYDLGFEHISNGGMEDDAKASRGWNTAYVYVPLKLDVGNGNVFFSTKIFVLFGEDKDNTRIREYTGFYEVEIATRDFFRGILSYDEVYVAVRPGGKEGGRLTKGSLETGVRFKLFKDKTAPHAFLQYFTGYGETQLTYNQKTHALRIGLSL